MIEWPRNAFPRRTDATLNESTQFRFAMLRPVVLGSAGSPYFVVVLAFSRLN